jgi:hypothetical protein
MEDEQGRAGNGGDGVELEAADALDDLVDGLRRRREREPLCMEG